MPVRLLHWKVECAATCTFDGDSGPALSTSCPTSCGYRAPTVAPVPLKAQKWGLVMTRSLWGLAPSQSYCEPRSRASGLAYGSERKVPVVDGPCTGSRWLSL